MVRPSRIPEADPATNERQHKEDLVRSRDGVLRAERAQPDRSGRFAAAASL